MFLPKRAHMDKSVILVELKWDKDVTMIKRQKCMLVRFVRLYVSDCGWAGIGTAF